MATPILAPKATGSRRRRQLVNLEQFTTPEANRRVTDQEAVWLESLKTQGFVHTGIAWRFFTSGDSREAGTCRHPRRA